MLLFSRALWERPAVQPTPVTQDPPVTAGEHVNPGIAVGEPHGNGRLFLLSGTEQDETLDVRQGAFISGGGGDDVFVLNGSEGRLAVVLDLSEGDKFDLSQLGAKAQVLGTVAGGGEFGGDRISVDVDGDGKEDGFVLAFAAGKAPDLSVFDRSSTPAEPDGVFHILPYPMPGDGPINIGEGEYHILPYPMPGDGPFNPGEGEHHILPYPFPAAGTWEEGTDSGMDTALVMGPVSGPTDWLA